MEVADMGQYFVLPPGCEDLYWPPHNLQLLVQPELLDCMIVVASRMDSAAFAMEFVRRIVAESDGGAVLQAPQRMQLVAATVEALAAGLEQSRQKHGQAAEIVSDHFCNACRSLVQLLQCMAPLSVRREGVLVLVPHAQALQHAAAALRHDLSSNALYHMELTQQQVVACSQWAQQTAAATVVALQATTAQYAEAAFRQRCILIDDVAPMYGADPRAYAVAMNKFVCAAVRVEQLQQLLLLAGVEAGV
jgi:hypothetical protein